MENEIVVPASVPETIEVQVAVDVSDTASAKNAEAWAVGQRGGVDVPSTDPTYHNNAKYYAEQAGSSATAAGTSETNAGTSEGNAEAWAKGTKDGAAVGSSDPTYHNNAKYYAEQAGASATSAAEAAASASAAYGTDLLAPDYSNLTFPVLKGKICIYDGDVYEAKQDINESEAWTAAHWKQITIGGQIEHLDRAVITLEMLEKARSFTPAQIQEIARDGTAEDYFAPGDIIMIPWTDNTPATPVTYQYPFVVTHIGDVIDDQDAVHHNAIYLMAMYATPQTIQFDHPEAIIATEETFQADTYYYIKNGDDWVEQTVEVGAAIPSGTTYYKHCRTGMAGRIRYGSNNYKESAYRQWLNSSGGKGEWWTAQHDSDVAPDQANTVPGFLTGFTAEWLAIFKPVQVKCYRNTSCDGGGWDTMYDKFFLPSVEEMYGSPQLSGEGVYWEYWKDELGLNSPTNGSSSNTNDARKIPSVSSPTGSAVNVRLRSANRFGTYYVWLVNAAGYLSNGSAYGASRAQPACVIY